jgi:hypothetical protein
MADDHHTLAETIRVKTDLTTVYDDRRACDLFARILRAVREQKADDEKRKRNGVDATEA